MLLQYSGQRIFSEPTLNCRPIRLRKSPSQLFLCTVSDYKQLNFCEIETRKMSLNVSELDEAIGLATKNTITFFKYNTCNHNKCNTCITTV